MSAFDCCRICIQLPRPPGAPPAPGDVPSANPEPFPGARAAGSWSHGQEKPLPAPRWAARAPRLSAGSQDTDPAQGSSIRRRCCWTHWHGAEPADLWGRALVLQHPPFTAPHSPLRLRARTGGYAPQPAVPFSMPSSSRCQYAWFSS